MSLRHMSLQAYVSASYVSAGVCLCFAYFGVDTASQFVKTAALLPQEFFFRDWTRGLVESDLTCSSCLGMVLDVKSLCETDAKDRCGYPLCVFF